MGFGVGVGVGVGVVVSPSFRWSRATSSSIFSSSFGCSCRISMFMMLSSSFSVVVGVVEVVDVLSFDVSWGVSYEFLTSSFSSFLLLSVGVIIVIFCEIFAVAFSISLL